MVVATSTIAIITAAAAVASAAGSAVSGIQAQQQAKKQAKIQEQQAERERQVAAQNEADFRKRQHRAAAAVRAATGARGIEGSVGSPLLASEDFGREVEEQARRIREGGEISATRLEQQADLTRSQGSSALTSGLFGAGGSLLRGAGRTGLILNDYYNQE